MGHLEGNCTPVLYIGRKVPKGYGKTVKWVSAGERGKVLILQGQITS